MVNHSKNLTGLQVIHEWASQYGSLAKAAKHIVLPDGQSLTPDHFRIWLREPNRGLDPTRTQAVALAVGLPIEAILFKNTRLKDLPCEKARNRLVA